MKLTFLFIFILVIYISQAAPVGVVQALVEGVVGSPAFHKTQTVKFDPHVSKRRNPEFEALNGHHSVHLIERLGLGMDGYQAQRLQEQRHRDSLPLIIPPEYQQ